MNMPKRQEPCTCEEFVGYLERRGQKWTTAAELEIALATHRRQISLLADESKGRVISGGLGYKLQDYATQAEILSAYTHLSDIIAALQTRATDIMSHYHRRRKSQDTHPELF